MSKQVATLSGNGLPYIVTSDTDSDSDPRNEFLSILHALKEDVRKFRMNAGLHDDEETSFRRDRWEITVAKLMALDLAIDAVLSMPRQNLTVEKSIFHLLELEALAFDAKYDDSTKARMFSTADQAAGARNALRSFSKKLSGSAGTQPKNGEVNSDPGPCCRTDPGSSLAGFLDTLPLSDLQALSEASLDALERRGCAFAWGAVHAVKAAMGGF